MDLVLFEQAMEHVCRIVRIISNPGGHALLVGVGGSGKQSLSKLAAHICGYDVRQLAVTAKFGVADLKEALKEKLSTEEGRLELELRAAELNGVDDQENEEATPQREDTADVPLGRQDEEDDEEFDD